MTIVSEIVVQAMRENNLLATGENPTPGEASEAKDRLDSIILSCLGSEIGYILEDWNISGTATRSTGQVIFSGLPVAGQTLTIGPEVYTFRASRAVAFEVTIGGSATLTGDNLVTALGLDSTHVTGVNLTGTVTLTAKAAFAGTAGNAINLSETATNTAVSGAFMTGAVQASVIKKPSSFSQNASTYTVRPQSRLICNLVAASTFNLDPQPQDGQRLSVVDAASNFDTLNLTLNGNGRLIEGSPTLVIDDAGAQLQWVYRSDLGNWVPVAPLDDADEMPFPSDFDDYFIIMLSQRLDPRYGETMKPESADRLASQKVQLATRYNQSKLRQAALPVNRQTGFGNASTQGS